MVDSMSSIVPNTRPRREGIGTTGMERLLSTQEVATRLSVDRKTVLRYLRSGKLNGSRIGRDYRIPEGAVDALLRRTNSSVPAERQAVVTAVVNQKGGVGKTTTTFNLGVGLQRLGRRVLLVDLDPQASLSQAPVSRSPT